MSIFKKKLSSNQEDPFNLTRFFGKPDDIKFRSCLTLFAYISKEESIFHQLLDKYFDGESDRRTLECLKKDFKWVL